MLSLTLVRSLVLGETLNNHPLLSNQNHNHTNGENPTSTNNKKTPFLLFMPTKEIITNTYRLATIARQIGMDLHPTPSLSHIIFSIPSSSSSSSNHPSSSSSFSSLWSSVSLSSISSFSLPNNAVPLTFPCLSSSSVSLLRSFVSLTKGLFKLVFIAQNPSLDCHVGDGRISNWDCCTLSLFSRVTGDRIDTMDRFCRVLAGMGWTLYKTKDNLLPDSGQSRAGKPAYLFRKMDVNRVRARIQNGGNGEVMGNCRMRELRLPFMDFRNAPLRILQYILLMTDDVFYLK